MAAVTAKINPKNMDYFKFKKIVIDGNRDDYESCSREIRALCDSVQTLAFRDEHFADDVVDDSDFSQSTPSSSDRRHFDEILAGYRLILTGKRVDPVDIRVKTGWWADTGTTTGSCGSAGKFKSSALRETLQRKTADWRCRYDGSGSSTDEMDRPGVFVFKHRERQCYQFVGRTAGQRGGVFASCTDLLKSTFDGTLNEPLAALLVVSMAADWDFYYFPLDEHDDDRMLRIAVNDVIIRHDALWPRGLNQLLYVQTPLEVAELRQSCLRHRWPPSDAELQSRETQLNLPIIRARLKRYHATLPQPAAAAKSSTAESTTTNQSTSTTSKTQTSNLRTSAGRTPAAASTQQQISPVKSTQQPNKSNLPSATSRRATPATTKSNIATSPTKTPRSRPQSAPKQPPPAATSSSRPSQQSTSTLRARSQSAKSAVLTGDRNAGKPRRSHAVPVQTQTAAESADTVSTSATDQTASENGMGVYQHPPASEHNSPTSAAVSNDLMQSAVEKSAIDCTTAPSYQQIPAAV